MFHRRTLPSAHIALDSPAGTALLAQHLASVAHPHRLTRLLALLDTQAEPAYCGIAALTTALNTLVRNGPAMTLPLPRRASARFAHHATTHARARTGHRFAAGRSATTVERRVALVRRSAAALLRAAARGPRIRPAAGRRRVPRRVQRCARLCAARATSAVVAHRHWQSRSHWCVLLLRCFLERQRPISGADYGRRWLLLLLSATLRTFVSRCCFCFLFLEQTLGKDAAFVCSRWFADA